MEWLIALGVFVAGLGLVALAASGKKKSRPGAVVGVFEDLLPGATLIARENEKRLEMEGEDDAGDPPA